MNGGRRRGFTDLIIQSLGAAANAASPVTAEAAGAEGLRTRLRGGSFLRPDANLSTDLSTQAAERQRP